MNCLTCVLTCCNNDAGEIKHGYTSLKWCVKELKRRVKKGDPLTEDFLQRIEDQVIRVGIASDNCGRRKMSDLKRLLEQVTWLAVCIYHEARGELLEGQIAVGHAIMNRVAKRDKSIKKIVLQPWQFSWANINVIERQPLPPISNYGAYIECMHAAFMCLIERLEGKDLYGADHYFNPKVTIPSWASAMSLVSRIGNHDFYKS